MNFRNAFEQFISMFQKDGIKHVHSAQFFSKSLFVSYSLQYVSSLCTFQFELRRKICEHWWKKIEEIICQIVAFLSHFWRFFIFKLDHLHLTAPFWQTICSNRPWLHNSTWEVRKSRMQSKFRMRKRMEGRDNKWVDLFGHHRKPSHCRHLKHDFEY